MYDYTERIVNELLDMMLVSGGDSEVNGPFLSLSRGEVNIIFHAP